MEPKHAQVEQVPMRTGRMPRAILFLTVFIDLLGFGIVIPFLPLFAKQMGVGAIGVGVVLATYSLMQLLFAPLLGRLSDSIGRRPVIMIGLAGSAIGYLLYASASSFFWLVLSRAIHGICAATVSTAQAYMADTTAESERTHGMGLIGAAFGLGFVLGPALGGVLGRSSLHYPAFFAAALSAANLVFAWFALPESLQSRAARALRFDELLAPLLRLPRTLARSNLHHLFTLAFVFTTIFAALESTIALVASGRYGFGAPEIGGLFAIAGLLQALTQGYFVGRIAKSFGELRLARVGALVMAAGLLPIGTVRLRWTLGFFVSIAAVGYGLCSPAVAGAISKRTSRQHQGEIMGANQSVLSLARIFGPMAAGITYQMLGPSAPYLASGTAAVLSILLMAGEN